MTTMTLAEAKDRLDELLAKAARGEEVVIATEDDGVFKVVRAGTAVSKKRDLVGSARGQIRMADDFEDVPECFEEYLQ